MIDLDGITSRVVALPIEAGHIENLAAGADGQTLLHPPRGVRPGQGPAARGKPSLRRFDLKTREEETLAEGIDDYQLSADRKKILYRAGEPPVPFGPPGGTVVLGIVDAGKFKKGDGALKLDAISVRVEPRAEWAQMFHEAWRINRDYFYATNMHGADWNAMRGKYEELLPHLASRDDLNRVIRMMLSELSVGHSYLGGGERLYEPKPIPVGLLGADYDVADGRFRFKTIYGGAYWDPSLRAPLAAPGVDVKPGDFLLAVDGKDDQGRQRGLPSIRGHGRQAGRAQGRAQGRRLRRTHGRRRADRRRGRPPQPRLGRGEPPQGPRTDQGAGRVCLRAQYGRIRI